MLLQVALRFQCKQAYKAAGFVTNRRQEQAVATAVIAAQQIPDSSVELADSTGQLACVTSMQDSSVKYEVKAAGTTTASCTCAHAQLHYLRKHMMKVVSLSSGHSGAQIIQALGTRAGSSLQGFDKLQCNTVTQTDSSCDQMAQLEQRFALSDFESELQPAPKPAPKRQQVSQQGHDSAACQQQMESVYREVLGEVSGNPQLEQHLLAQLYEVRGSIAKIKANSVAGTSHPMAILDRVQDSWGNSLVRKKTVGLDGFPKQRKRQKAGNSETAAEPFTKPAAPKKKQGPREQAKAAAADKENSPSAAKAQSTDDAAVAQGAKASKPPRGPSQARCGECATCRNPNGKKGCRRNKAQREVVAIQPLRRFSECL